METTFHLCTMTHLHILALLIEALMCNLYIQTEIKKWLEVNFDDDHHHLSI